MTGPLEPTNEAYATAKLAGWKLCQAYRQQYGADFITAHPGERLRAAATTSTRTSGHVIPALIRRMHEAKVQRRARADRLGHRHAAARVHLRRRPRRRLPVRHAALRRRRRRSTSAAAPTCRSPSWPSASPTSSATAGRLVFDATQPDGMPRKVLDAGRAARLGWRPRTDFARRLWPSTYDWFLRARGHTRTRRMHDARAVSLAVPHPPRRGGDRPRSTRRDRIKSPVHLSIGQEAVSVGVCEALRPDDVVFGTYRGHALYLAKGGDLRAMVAELYGKATGCTKGKGGSMHLIDAGGRRDGHVRRRRHHHRQRRRLRLRRSRLRAPDAPSSSASSATARPRKASSPRASTSPRSSGCRSCSSARTTATRSTPTSATARAGADICARPGATACRRSASTDNDVLGDPRAGQRRGRCAIRAGGGPWFFEVMTLPLARARRPGRGLTTLGYRTRGRGRAVDRERRGAPPGGELPAAERGGGSRTRSRRRSRDALRLRRGRARSPTPRTVDATSSRRMPMPHPLRQSARGRSRPAHRASRCSRSALSLRRGRPRGHRPGDGARPVA